MHRIARRGKGLYLDLGNKGLPKGLQEEMPAQLSSSNYSNHAISPQTIEILIRPGSHILWNAHVSVLRNIVNSLITYSRTSAFLSRTSFCRYFFSIDMRVACIPNTTLRVYVANTRTP